MGADGDVGSPHKSHGKELIGKGSTHAIAKTDTYVCNAFCYAGVGLRGRSQNASRKDLYFDPVFAVGLHLLWPTVEDPDLQRKPGGKWYVMVSSMAFSAA